MKHASHVRFVMAFLTAAGLIPLHVSAATPSVVFSEVNWGGSTLSQADEWIELVNLSDEIISLAGWTIGGAASGNAAIMLPEGTLAPHALFLLSNYADTSPSSTLANEPSFVTTSLSLSNSTLGLSLRDASGTLIDSVGDGTAPPAGQSKEPHASMQRVDPTMDGSLDEAWVTAQDQIGFDEGIEQYGSPGLNPWWTPSTSIGTVVTLDPLSESTTVLVDPMTEQGVPIDTIDEETSDGSIEELPLFSETVLESNNPMPEATVTEPEPPEAMIQEQIISPEESIEIPTETVIEPDTAHEEIVHAAPEASPVPINYSSLLQINALLPSPAHGENEWVEIINTSNETVSLMGWTLQEGSGKITPISNETLERHGSILVSPIKGNLNNGGDYVELLSPDGLVQDFVLYEEDLVPGVGEILERSGGNWVVIPASTEPLPDVPVEPTRSIETTVQTAESPIIIAEAESTAVLEPIVVTTDNTGVAVDFSSIRLSKLYPNTNGSDADEEFIEISNSGTTSIVLTGLSLWDASGKTFDLSTQTIPAASSLSLTRNKTNIVLNNDRETVSLQTADGTTIDFVSYENAPKGSTLVRTNDAWAWSPLPTTTQSSVVSTNEERTTSTTRTGTAAGVTTPRTNRSRVTTPRTLTAQQIQDTADGTRVRYSGTVAIAPGVSGRQIFYSTDSTGTVQIYKNDAVFPELQVGDRVDLTGTLSTAQGEKRIKIMKSDKISITGHEDTSLPATQTIATLTQEDIGNVVDISGTVREVDRGEITLEDGMNTIVVKLPTGTSAVSSGLAPGADVSIAGLLTVSDKGYRLLARSNDDIRITPTTAPAEEPTGQEVQAASDTRIARTLGAAVLLILCAGAVREYYPRLKHWYAKHSVVRHAS